MNFAGTHRHTHTHLFQLMKNHFQFLNSLNSKYFHLEICSPFSLFIFYFSYITLFVLFTDAKPQTSLDSSDSTPRERTGSVPTSPSRAKPALTKMSSVPLGCGLAGTPTLITRPGHDAPTSQSDTGKSKLDTTSTRPVRRTVTEGSEDTASISSNESGASLITRRLNMLNSDGEEKSLSSKDSGYHK
jgi:hypothetical protein